MGSDDRTGGTYRPSAMEQGCLTGAATALYLVALGSMALGRLLSVNLTVPVALLAASGLILLALKTAQRYTYLITSPRGIQYVTPGTDAFILWSNVERIGHIHSSSSEGLVLREPVVARHRFGVGIPLPTSPIRFIPLTPFAAPWRDSDLGQDIRRHAPWLFEPQHAFQKGAD